MESFSATTTSTPGLKIILKINWDTKPMIKNTTITTMLEGIPESQLGIGIRRCGKTKKKNAQKATTNEY